jgi:hypothetical protein
MSNQKTVVKKFDWKEWKKKNPKYFKNYYKEHSDEMYASQQKYFQTDKGKEARKRFQNSPKRQKYLKEWNRKKRLERKKLKEKLEKKK